MASNEDVSGLTFVMTSRSVCSPLIQRYLTLFLILLAPVPCFFYSDPPFPCPDPPSAHGCLIITGIIDGPMTGYHAGAPKATLPRTSCHPRTTTYESTHALPLTQPCMPVLACCTIAFVVMLLLVCHSCATSSPANLRMQLPPSQQAVELYAVCDVPDTADYSGGAARFLVGVLLNRPVCFSCQSYRFLAG